VKRLLGILLILILVGVLLSLVYYDISSHASVDSHSIFDEIIHYVIHIVICVIFCTLFHNSMHKFLNWVIKLVGFKIQDSHKD